jgi:hypothetical protein
MLIPTFLLLAAHTGTAQIKNKKIISIRDADTKILNSDFWRCTLGCG